MSDVDVIVIGSGAGGLNAALGCALAGKKVLVLEQHYLPGGWCHSFPLGGYEFSPGVHYIGDLDNGGLSQQIYEGLGVAKHMTFLELNPDGYDHVCLGDDFRFDIPKGFEAQKHKLQLRFPDDAVGIAAFLDTLAAVRNELTASMSHKGRPTLFGSKRLGRLASTATMPFRAPTLARWGARSLQSLLDAHIRDPQCKAVLSIQCGNYGVGPSRVPVAMHATVTGHYFNGGWYPKGGAKAIPRAYLRELKAHGGEIRLSTEVRRIRTHKGQVVGVELGDGTLIDAPMVISNADPHLTYTKMMDVAQLPRKLQRKLAKTRYSLSSLSLFAAVDMDLEAMGYDSGNYWFNTDADIDGAYSRTLARGDEAEGAMDGCFLTITSLKDRTKLKGTTHTVEVFNIMRTEPWAGTSGEPGARSQAYSDQKERLLDRLVDTASRVIPGLGDHLVFRELGTPATNQFYVRSTDGNMYGTEKTLDQSGPFAFGIRSPIEGLYLCGSSTVSHGVIGASWSGLIAAAKATRTPTSELLNHRDAGIEIWPADRVQDWPEAAQVRQKRTRQGAPQ